jgi:hypothetical protein
METKEMEKTRKLCTSRAQPYASFIKLASSIYTNICSYVRIHRRPVIYHTQQEDRETPRKLMSFSASIFGNLRIIGKIK